MRLTTETGHYIDLEDPANKWDKYVDLATQYKRNGQYKEAVDIYIKLIDLLKKEKEYKNLSTAYYNLAKVYFCAGDAENTLICGKNIIILNKLSYPELRTDYLKYAKNEGIDNETKQRIVRFRSGNALIIGAACILKDSNLTQKFKNGLYYLMMEYSGGNESDTITAFRKKYDITPPIAKDESIEYIRECVRQGTPVIENILYPSNENNEVLPLVHKNCSEIPESKPLVPQTVSSNIQQVSPPKNSSVANTEPKIEQSSVKENNIHKDDKNTEEKSPKLSRHKIFFTKKFIFGAILAIIGVLCILAIPSQYKRDMDDYLDREIAKVNYSFQKYAYIKLPPQNIYNTQLDAEFSNELKYLAYPMLGSRLDDLQHYIPTKETEKQQHELIIKFFTLEEAIFSDLYLCTQWSPNSKEIDPDILGARIKQNGQELGEVVQQIKIHHDKFLRLYNLIGRFVQTTDNFMLQKTEYIQLDMIRHPKNPPYPYNASKSSIRR